MFRPYRDLAATPHLLALMLWSLAARLHVPANAIAVTFLVAGWTHSYGWAGVVVAALVVGISVSGPLRGRAADRGDGVRALVVNAGFRTAAMFALAVLPGSWWPVAPVLAFGAGLVTPPVNQIARTLWSQAADERTREAAFAVEATLQELLFVIGPVLAASAVALVNARAAMVLCGLLVFFGTLGFALRLRRSGYRPGSTSVVSGRRAAGSVLRQPGLLPLLGVGVLLVAGVSAVDLALVAWARALGHPELAGGLSGVWAAGSVLGGLNVGGLARRPSIAFRTLLTGAGVAVLVPLLPPVGSATPWLVGAVLLVGGLAIAPTVAAVNSRLGAIAPADQRGEVFGWWASATTAGVALASPVAGWTLDHAGVSASVAVSAALVLGAAVLAMCTGSDRGRDETRARDDRENVAA